MSWKEIIGKKHSQLDEAIPSDWKHDFESVKGTPVNSVELLDKFMSDDELHIINSSASDLTDAIKEHKLTSVEITTAFCHRAALAHQLLSCCTNFMFNDAIDRAKKLDKAFAETGKLVGPFHGIPISLKDQFNVPGYDTTIGYCDKALVPTAEDEKSPLVSMLESMGAVIYVKTTVPMAMLTSETSSNMYGYTANPIKASLTSGGSSGGEGALIGSHGSLIGLGTDIGGSVRIPSSQCGLYGLKPSNGRIPYLKVTNSLPGQEIVSSVIGPLARHFTDLKLLAKGIIDCQPWLVDPKCHPIPWRETCLLSTKLCFAIFWSDGILTPHPPIKRALKETAAALQAAGHEVLFWDPPVKNLLNLYYRVTSADGFEELISTCEKTGEPVIPQISYKFALMKDGLRKQKTVLEWFDLAMERYKMQADYLAYWMSQKGPTTGRVVDAVISPTWPSVAYPPGENVGLLNYTAIYNVLDYPSCVIPATKVTKDDKPFDDFVPISDRDKRLMESYDLDLMEGLPVSIQIACRKLEEEKVVAATEVVMSALGK